MVPSHQPKSGFGKWLLKYRLLITLVGIFILVPMAFVIALYVGDYLKYKNVSFNDEVISSFNNTYMTTETSTNHEEINLDNGDLIVKIKLESILVPQYSDENGNYTFKARYEEIQNKAVSNVQVTMILQTDWMNAKSDSYQANLQKTYGNNKHLVSFNTILPHSPLWFVNIERPNLYVQVSYQISLGLGQTETRNVYYRTELKGLTTSTQIDAIPN